MSVQINNINKIDSTNRKQSCGGHFLSIDKYSRHKKIDYRYYLGSGLIITIKTSQI